MASKIHAKIDAGKVTKIDAKMISPTCGAPGRQKTRLAISRPARTRATQVKTIRPAMWRYSVWFSGATRWLNIVITAAAPTIPNNEKRCFNGPSWRRKSPTRMNASTGVAVRSPTASLGLEIMNGRAATAGGRLTNHAILSVISGSESTKWKRECGVTPRTAITSRAIIKLNEPAATTRTPRRQASVAADRGEFGLDISRRPNGTQQNIAAGG